MGVVATPAPTKDNPLTDTINSALPMFKDPPRADALLVHREPRPGHPVAHRRRSRPRPNRHRPQQDVPRTVLEDETRRLGDKEQGERCGSAGLLVSPSP